MRTIWFNQGYSSVRDALAMIRAGAAESGVMVRLIASHRDAGAPAMAEADLAIVEPVIDRESRDYMDWCVSVCADHDVDLFVVQSGRAALALWREAFATIGTRMSIPGDAATLRLIDDKAAFCPAALAADLPMPWTREIATADEFDAALAALDALGLEPCVKPPEGVFGAGFWRLDTSHDLFAGLMNPHAHRIAPAAIRAALATAEAPRLLVLEHLPGEEMSIDCVARHGKALALVGRRKLGRVQRLEVEGPAIDIARRAVAAFGLSGLINIQVRAAAGEDDLRLLEINSRMSGGCFHTIHAGINLPWLDVGSALGEIADDDIPVPQGGALVGEALHSRLVAPAPVERVHA